MSRVRGGERVSIHADGSAPRRAWESANLHPFQSGRWAWPRLSVALAAAAVTVLGLVGTGARAAVTVFADGGQPRVPVAAPVITSPSPTPTPTTKKVSGKQAPKQRQPTIAKLQVPESGPGTFVSVRISGRPAARAATVLQFDVRRETGMAVDAEAAARTMQSVLNDRRSWRATRKAAFQLVSTAEHADLHVYIATPDTTDRLCAPLLTRGKLSCQVGNRVVLNAKRWVFGAETYGNDIINYRRYLINHEFGHTLGYQHTDCAGKGKTADIMIQQTKGLGGCKANPWPYPKGQPS